MRNHDVPRTGNMDSHPTTTLEKRSTARESSRKTKRGILRRTPTIENVTRRDFWVGGNDPNAATSEACNTWIAGAQVWARGGRGRTKRGGGVVIFCLP